VQLTVTIYTRMMMEDGFLFHIRPSATTRDEDIVHERKFDTIL
jgi:hypothetical protein